MNRDLKKGKHWAKHMAHGSECFGMIVSSQALRRKPYAMDVRSPMDPVHWFLGVKEDVPSSYYLKDVATEFHVQGLELDWACVTWDADFRYTDSGWEHYSFCWGKMEQNKKRRTKAIPKKCLPSFIYKMHQRLLMILAIRTKKGARIEIQLRFKIQYPMKNREQYLQRRANPILA